ncbi:MAG TPA: SNF2 helicase associated domain-containing protein [Bacillota bacterium]|nr:SNF2 helicase associated domain-containing protein [Bacillota bacterium]
MSYSTTSSGISLNDIRYFCGSTSYKRGEVYYKNHRVLHVTYDPDESRYDAIVRGSENYHVSITEDEVDLEASCECPAFHSYSYWCKHVAAVLFHIHAQNKNGSIPSFPPTSSPKSIEIQESLIASRDLQLTKNLISLFEEPSLGESLEGELSEETIQLLDVEFVCKAITFSSQSNLIGIEMKIGVGKRRYIVQKIKDFLFKIQHHLSHLFTKNFTYDPSIHTFKQADWEIIQQLSDICRSEVAYRDVLSRYLTGSTIMNDRFLFIPPLAWDKLVPKLNDIGVCFEHGGKSYDRIEIKEQQIPLSFTLDKARMAGYQLDIQGMEKLFIMENYRYALTNGVLYKLTGPQIQRLSKIQDILHYSSDNRVIIAPSQIEAFLDHVIPQLKKIGNVSIAQQISDQLLNPPLQTKIFVDRDDQRLLVRLEFHYGEIMIEPLLKNAVRQDSTGRILVRDSEGEKKTIRIFEHEAYKSNGNYYFMDNEEEIYRFLYKILPTLEKQADIYLTPTLKAILFKPMHQPKVAVEVDSKTQWLDIRFDIEGIEEKEIRQVLRSIVEKKKYYRLSTGAFLSLEEDGFQEIGNFIEEMGIRKTEIKGKHIELSVVRSFSLMDDKNRTSVIKMGKTLRQLLDNMKHPENLDFEIPSQISSILRDYQNYGFQWMKTLSFYHFGGILADDMGLGKTLQAITYILSEKLEGHAKELPVLIISPASLIYNWRNEIKKFAPELKAVIAAGDRQERSDLLDNLTGVDVIITSYPLLRRDVDWYAKQCFSCLILDEAQAIKNHTTQTAQAVRELQANHRFALTGTPVENTLDELWSIFDAVFPELFSSKKAFNELSKENMARKVRPFILRRMKSDVLKELPDKIETLQTTELLPEQKKLYLAYLAKLQAETIQDLQIEGFSKSRMKILAGLTRLRQLCCHPALFMEDYNGDSSKLDQLLEMVEEYRSSGKRMLIFSQFTEMLGIIRQKLKGLGVHYFYLDGKTPASERVELCQQFNNGEQEVFLISLKAGGTGLNLTGADTVILYDLWWNPAVEQQATDRAHRMGQKNVVQVIRLITQGTIEEKMYELQQQKKDLTNHVIQPGEEAISALSEKEIREILMLGAQAN